jgi:diguanylate cyclase (GGDEF)-like protein/hemerythrin-like metal-binding protein/PAS domain S-box-containing protein
MPDRPTAPDDLFLNTLLLNQQWLQILADWASETIKQTGRLTQDGFAESLLSGLKRAQHSLQSLEGRYQLVFEQSQDVIWICQASGGKLSFISPAVEALLGYTVAEALALPLEAFFKTGTADSIVKPLLEKAAQYALTGQDPGEQRFEVRMVHKSGQAIWVEITARYRLADDQSVELIGVTRNVNDRKQYELLRYLSDHDSLTGLYNRHYFDSIIEHEMEFADRYGHPLSMILLDLDYFKRINDQFGHPSGDEVLRTISQLLVRKTRSSDVLVRFGGEEFLILLPHTTLDNAARVAEKLRAAVEAESFPDVGSVTISLGFAERMRAESFNHLYRRMDDALYRAKSNGRNRAILSSGLERLSAAVFHLDWRSEWNSGNDLVDEQHKELNLLGNRLIELALSGKEQSGTLAMLDQLIAHVITHFADEEAIMAEHGYPDLALHQSIHQKLKEKVLSLREAFVDGGVKATAFFSFVIDDLMIGHLQNVDTRFFPFLSRHD